MRVLVAGAGIAGLSFAWWLRRSGHDAVVAERAPSLRDAGYMIDFFGPGWDVAERMGILPRLAEVHDPIPYLRFVDRAGREKFSLRYDVIRRRLFAGRHFNFMRGDLERVLYERVASDVEIRFGTAAESVQEEFDLLVGADGVHSAARRLVCGDIPLRFLGYRAAAFIVPSSVLPPERRDAFYTITVPGRQVSIYPIRGGRTATLFLREAGERLTDRCPDALHRELLTHYGDLPWLVPELIAAAPQDPEPYFDGVEQVELPRWSHGRVVLLGDAAWCVSLLAGQGASLAMAGAAALASALPSSVRDLDPALYRYETSLRPEIVHRQAVGRKTARWFVPPTPFHLLLRDLGLRASVLPGIAGIFRRRAL
jgi:2-polyprenyl-6-methoxyphenol hydroxylase-like FAD-dependent oxidoreductase